MCQQPETHNKLLAETRAMKKILALGIVIVGCFAAYRYLANDTDEFIPDITTAEVSVGDIVDAVGATGTLEAVTTLQVGSQVSGIFE